MGGALSFFVLVVIGLATASGERKLFLGHRRRTDFVFVKGDQVSNDAFVELDGALVLGERGGLGAEARDDVVAGLTPADRVRELAASPVVELKVGRISEQAVKSTELVGDGGVFERGIEDVDRLILARHAWAILPLVWTAPRWLPEQGEGKCYGRLDLSGSAAVYPVLEALAHGDRVPTWVKRR